MKATSLVVIAALMSNSVAVSIKQSQELKQQLSSELNEMNRYIGGDGQPISLAETSGHFKIELTEVKKTNQPAATEPQEKGTTHLFQENLSDNMYLGDIYVGTPPQKIRALFDTGSSNTWIMNKKAPINKELFQKGTFQFDDTKSSTFKSTQQQAQISFGSGTLGGHFVTDDVRVGQYDKGAAGEIVIKNMKFGNVEQQKTIFGAFDAIVGMAYPQFAEKGVTPLFDEMKNQKLLKNNLFAFYFAQKSLEAKGVKSDLTFGYYDKAKFEGDIHWNPVEYQYMFGVPLDDILFNGKPSNICVGHPHQCLITFDSGTTLMSMPAYATNLLTKQGIPYGASKQKCDSEKQFGTMTFVIGGKHYELSNSEWMFPAEEKKLQQSLSQVKSKPFNYERYPMGPQLQHKINSADFEPQLQQQNELMHAQVDNPKDVKSTKPEMACASRIFSMEVAQSMFLVGGDFMRKYYTIFDRDNNRVGLAKSKGYTHN